jgi:hypothetical protein
MTEAAEIKEAAAINEEMLDALLVIHHIARRALSDEERVGQRIQRDLCLRSPRARRRGLAAVAARGAQGPAREAPRQDAGRDPI